MTHTATTVFDDIESSNESSGNNLRGSSKFNRRKETYEMIPMPKTTSNVNPTLNESVEGADDIPSTTESTLNLINEDIIGPNNNNIECPPRQSGHRPINYTNWILSG
jgi:hypothetical protein